MLTSLVLPPLLLVAAAAATAPLSVAAAASRSRHQLLLVSLDGFRYDYLTKFAKESRFLRRMAADGVYVRAMMTEFLTKTFPNHWTMVTGLHPESHGIVSNSMYDPVFNASFNMSTSEERWWNDSLPIWITAKRQGLKSAVLSWPGGDVQFAGSRPEHFVGYGVKMSGSQRVDTVLRWLTEERVDFCALYFNQPDYAGHGHGPNSVEVAEAIKELDNLLKSLVDGLQRKGFKDRVDIIVGSDHGMAEMSTSRMKNFNGSLDAYVERYVDSGPHLSMFAKAGKKQLLVELVRNESRSFPLKVFAKEDLPRRFHYSNHRRIPDVLVLPNLSYAAVGDAIDRLLTGNHGYDNMYDKMKVPLIAVGPSFKRGVQLDGFRQLDIYGLMCHLLQIAPQPNNGSLALLPKMLKDASSLQPPTLSVMMLVSVLVTGLFAR